MNTVIPRRRVWSTMFAWGWRAAPGWTAYTAVLLVGNAVTSVLYPVALAIVIDASLRHQSGSLLLGIAAVAVLYTITWALAMFAGTAGAVVVRSAAARSCLAASGSDWPSPAA